VWPVRQWSNHSISTFKGRISEMMMSSTHSRARTKVRRLTSESRDAPSSFLKYDSLKTHDRLIKQMLLSNIERAEKKLTRAQVAVFTVT
jgi:hypothetical protein